MNDLPTFRKPMIFSRSAHQAVRDKADAADRVEGDGDIYVEDVGTSKTISHNDPPVPFLSALAKIVAPESSTYTYASTSPRYRCRVQKIIFGTVNEDIIKLADETNKLNQPEGGTTPSGSSDPPVGWTVTATNLAEITDPTNGTGTHILPEDGTVVVEIKGYYDKVDGQSARLRWVFTSGGASLPKAQYQHQIVGYMVSQNQMGASFVQAHGPLI